MKTINKIKSIVLAATLFASSCLELQPLSSLGDDYVWTSASNFQLFANQFYAWNRGFTIMMGDYSYSDIRTDIVGNYASTNDYSQGVHVVPTSDSNYGTAYTRIYYCNLLLENAAEYSAQDEISTPMGEAYFYRAYYHYELVRLYGDAIILTEPLDITHDKLYASQDNRTAVIDQVISDLYMAAELLPESVATSGLLTKNIAMANLARVALYEGTWQKFHTHCAGGATDEFGNPDHSNFGSYDVDDSVSNTTRSTEYLTIARDAAKYVIDSGEFQLFYSDILAEDSYRNMFFLDDSGNKCNVAGLTKSDNPEYIQVDNYKDGYTMAAVTHGCLYNAVIVSRKMADMYLDINGVPIDNASSVFHGRTGYVDEYIDRDPRMSSSLLSYSHTYWDVDTRWRVNWDDTDYDWINTCTKLNYTGYWNQKWGADRECVDSYESMDFPIIRYGEVLLAYAEAVYELSNSISDSDLDISLNLVRARAHMPSLSNSHVTKYGLSMREEIRRERTVELYMEGLRHDDLRRWATAGQEMPQDFKGVQHTGTAYAASWTSDYSLDSDGTVVFRTDRVWNDAKHYLYPLPSDELQLNPNLNQNPGW